MIKKIGILCIGLIILSLGIALFIKAELGADPFTTFNIGMSTLMNMNFSVVQIGINLLLLIGIATINKKYIGIGTLISMTMVGPLIEFNLKLINYVLNSLSSFPERIMLLVIGCILVSIGAGIYIAVNIGAGPYDIIPLLVEAESKISFQKIRILTDLGCVILGGILGVKLGLGTVIAAFCLGPSIQFFRGVCLKYIIND